MKRSIPVLLVSILVLCSALPLAAWQLGGKEMVLSGVGEREKFFVTIYFCYLYLPQALKGKDGTAILKADQPMAVILKVDSSKLTRERFVTATREGLQRAAASGYATPHGERFLALFAKQAIHVGDVIALYYVPGQGLTATYKVVGKDKAVTLGSIPGPAFKQALFAIWLGPDPVQESLKRGMLGRQ